MNTQNEIENILSGYNVTLTVLKADDLEQVRKWRNHPEIANNMLTNQYIDKEEQQHWFKSIRNKNNQRYYLISYNEKKIGVIYAKSLDEYDLLSANKIEPGLYIDPDCRFSKSILAFSPSLVLIEYLFSLPLCTQLVAKVLSKNAAAIRYNETLGYKKDNNLQSDIVKMILTKDEFTIAKEKLVNILKR